MCYVGYIMLLFICWPINASFAFIRLDQRYGVRICPSPRIIHL
jgi:hypothetical protein